MRVCYSIFMFSRMRKVLAFMGPHIKRYPKSLIASFVGSIAGAIIMEIYMPTVYKRLVDIISEATVRSEVAHEAFVIIAIVGVSVFAYMAIFRVTDYTLAYFTSSAIRDMHNAILRRFSLHSYGFYANNFIGSLVAKAKRFPRAFDQLAGVTVWDISALVATIIAVFVVMMTEVPLIAYFFGGWVLVYITVLGVILKFKRRYDLAEAQADSRVTGALADILTNMINVMTFSSRKREYRGYGEVTEDESEKRLKALNFDVIRRIVQAVLLIGLEVGAMYLAVHFWLEGTISTGTVVLVQSYVGVFGFRFWTLSFALTRITKAFADADELVEIIEQPIEIEDPRRPEKIQITKGHIIFDNVSFEYHDGQDVFSSFNLEIKPGEKIGLVGHSGSGKTTLTKILLRFADVVGGAITVDGQDIRKVRQDDLRDMISYVPQDPILFHRTLFENVAYAKPNATDKEVIAVAKKAHAHEFIKDLSHGYDTLVGERGVKLSGGERQRVAIARAMLKGAPIIVLDEATSSLDSVSETYIQDALVKLMKGKTTIVIAHRLSTVQKMDRIIVLDDGKIVEDGTHEQLLKKKGTYHELWSHQTSGFLE